MYIDIESGESVIEGFKYTNWHGGVDAVSVPHADCIKIYNPASQADEFFIYDKDIPKLIKALTLAYEYKTKEKIVG